MTLSSGLIGILALHFISEPKSLRQISSLVILSIFAGPGTTSGGGLSTSCWTSPASFNGSRIISIAGWESHAGFGRPRA
jgi:hypothetical protein